ncbi:MAG: tripartite tricarboxylate transporter TctB family protein [Burkholderiaceae bacterium]
MSDVRATRPGRGARLTALGLLVVALVGLSQVWGLERWGLDGPGPGLFPLVIAVVCVVLAAWLLVVPGPVRAGVEADADDVGSRIETRDTFAWYVVALLALTVGAMTAGFTITALLVSVIVVRFAERRSWRAAIAYGVVCALVGLVGFGWLLRVDLPEGRIERQFYSLVR